MVARKSKSTAEPVTTPVAEPKAPRARKPRAPRTKKAASTEGEVKLYEKPKVEIVDAKAATPPAPIDPTDNKVIEGQIVEQQGETALALQDESPRSITTIPLGALTLTNPAQVIEKVTEMAKELVKIVDSLGLFKIIKTKKYVFVDGWEILGGMLGVGAHEENSVRREDGSYEATVVLKRHNDGAIVGRASALVGMEETDSSGNLTWGARDEYARKSMATTRATGKAFRLTFSWIMKLAGYEGTPAEEMKSEETQAKEDAGSTNVETGKKRPAKPSDRKKAVALIVKYGVELGLDAEGKEIGAALRTSGKTFDDHKWDDIFTLVEKAAEAKKNPPAPVTTPVDPTDVAPAAEVPAQ
jgi:hypothetical protein